MNREHEKIIGGSREGWNTFNRDLLEMAQNDLITASWTVDYDKLGHDIILQCKVTVVQKSDVLLQVWLADQHPGIWIPELRPWVATVVEFEPQDDIKKAHLGLIDSKWRKEDIGATYTALLWGYLLHAGEVKNFAFDKSFTYPG